MKALGSMAAGLILLAAWYFPRPASVTAIAETQVRPKAVQPVADHEAKPSSKRLKIEVEVTSPSEIRVAEGQQVSDQQVIVDRQLERSTLTAQLQEVKLSIERLKTSPQVSPVPPASVSSLKALPQAQYLEESAQVKAAAAKLENIQRKYALAQTIATAPLPESGKVKMSAIAVRQAEETIKKQQQKIDALQTIEDLDPAIKQHEEAKMGQLRKTLVELQAKLEPDQQTEAVARTTRASNLEAARLELTIAQRDVELAKARLGAASEKRQQLEHEYQLKQNERSDQVKRLELERVKMLETGKLQEHDQEYQIAQLVLKHNQMQRQLADLAVIKTPYAGTIRRVKLASQRGGLLKYEIVLVYAPHDVGTKKNSWQTAE